MENLTLEDLYHIENWYHVTKGFSHGHSTTKDDEAYEKIKQAISDLEFEEKHPKYLS